MILKRTLLFAPDPIEGGNKPPIETIVSAAPSAPTPEPAKAPVKPLSPKLPRTPDAATLKQEFKTNDTELSDLGLDDVDEPTDKAAAKVTAEPAKVEAPKPAEPVKVEPKKEEPVKPAVKKGPNLLGLTQEEGAAPTADKSQSTRDYTGFSESETKVLKNMSKEAYEHVAPIMKEIKQLREIKDKAHFNHPNGYLLDPRYGQLQSEVVYAKNESDAWLAQLVKIQKGEKWTPLTGVDPKTGQFLYGPERDPLIEDGEKVRSAMMACQQAQQNAASILREVPQRFQQVVQQDLGNIQRVRGEHFDWVANPELLKHEVEVPGIGKKAVQAMREELASQFPAYMRGHPAVEVAADLWVNTILQGIKLKAAQQQTTVAETLKQEATRIEPTTTVRGGAPKPKFGVTDFDLAGMPD